MINLLIILDIVWNKKQSASSDQSLYDTCVRSPPRQHDQQIYCLVKRPAYASKWIHPTTCFASTPGVPLPLPEELHSISSTCSSPRNSFIAEDVRYLSKQSFADSGSANKILAREVGYMLPRSAIHVVRLFPFEEEVPCPYPVRSLRWPLLHLYFAWQTSEWS